MFCGKRLVSNFIVQCAGSIQVRSRIGPEADAGSLTIQEPCMDTCLYASALSDGEWTLLS
jgi:hypothetical protein